MRNPSAALLGTVPIPAPRLIGTVLCAHVSAQHERIIRMLPLRLLVGDEGRERNAGWLHLLVGHLVELGSPSRRPTGTMAAEAGRGAVGVARPESDKCPSARRSAVAAVALVSASLSGKHESGGHNHGGLGRSINQPSIRASNGSVRLTVRRSCQHRSCTTGKKRYYRLQSPTRYRNHLARNSCGGLRGEENYGLGDILASGPALQIFGFHRRNV